MSDHSKMGGEDAWRRDNDRLARKGYPKGAIAGAPYACCDTGDPNHHHHETTHTHPFTDIEHTHDIDELVGIEDRNPEDDR